MATPGPKPISRTRSVGPTASWSTAQRLRSTLEGLVAMIWATTRPSGPVGRWAWATRRRRRRVRSDMGPSKHLQVDLKSMGEAEPELLTIGELAEQVGVATSAL